MRSWAIALLATPALLAAQTPRAIVLGAGVTEFPESFTRIASVRELRDGRVIVIDPNERAITLVDLTAGTQSPIGRKGHGPGEYQSPFRMHALPGDTTLVTEALNSRMFRSIRPNGSMGDTVMLWARDAATRRFVSAVDGRGRFYGLPDLSARDTAVIERFDRSSNRYDTLGRISRRWVSSLPVPEPYISAGGRGRGRGAPTDKTIPLPPYATTDQWAVSADGRVAIVTADPYRVTFIDEKGGRTVGPIIPYDPLPVTKADKDLRREQWRIITSFRSLSAAPPPPLPPYEEPPAWPRYLSAFQNEALTFAPDGLLWVERMVGAGSPPLVDVIDRAGRLTARVTLPKNTRLIGFGNGTVYLVRTDDDDLEYLQRYKLPM
jgi:hypothetical protein